MGVNDVAITTLLPLPSAPPNTTSEFSPLASRESQTQGGLVSSSELLMQPVNGLTTGGGGGGDHDDDITTTRETDPTNSINGSSGEIISAGNRCVFAYSVCLLYQHTLSRQSHNVPF